MPIVSTLKKFWKDEVALIVVGTAAVISLMPVGQFLSGNISPSSGSASEYLNLPKRNSLFEWIGTLKTGSTPARQFTAAEIDTIVANNSIVVLPKFHAGYDKAMQHADARALKQRSNAVQVLFYISGRYVFIPEQPKFAALGFKDDWYLQGELGDYTGKKVPQDPDLWCLQPSPACVQQPPSTCDTWCKKVANQCQPICNPDSPKTFYMDMSNLELRTWLLDYMAAHFAAAPYSGIAFDSARKISEGNQVIYWSDKLTPEKITAWNNGLVQLLADARSRYSSAFIAFNGIGKVAQTPDRGVSLFPYTNAALNEWFCLAPLPGGTGMRFMDANEMLDEWNFVESYRRTDKTLLLRVDFSEVNDGPVLGKMLPDMARYCFGAFKLTHAMGRSYFKIGSYIVENESFYYPPEAVIRFGAPLGKGPTRSGSVFTREFTNGFVAVNASSTEQSYTLPNTRSLWKVRGDKLETLYPAGTTLQLAAHDAAFFVQDSGGPAQ